MWKPWMEDFIFTTTEEDSPKSATEVLLCEFFNKDGVIYWHVVPLYTMITTDAYIKILKSLRQHLWSKCPDLTRSFILHHNNACPTLSIWQSKRSKCCHIHSTVWIWPLVIFGCFQNWRNSWETRHFPQMRTSSWPATRFLLAFQPPNSPKHYRSGWNIKSGALKLMVTTLKKFCKEQYMYIRTTDIFSTCPCNFFFSIERTALEPWNLHP